MKSKFQIAMFLLLISAVFSLNINVVYAMENEEVNNEVTEVTEEDASLETLAINDEEQEEAARKEAADKAFAKLKAIIDKVEVIKSNRSEEEVTNLFRNDDYSVRQALYDELTLDVKNQLGEDSSLVYLDVNVSSDIHDASIYATYVDNESNIYVHYATNYEKPVKVVYTDTDKHEKDLDAKADQIVQNSNELITVDLGNEEEMNKYTEEEMGKILDDRINALLKDTGFTKNNRYERDFYEYKIDDNDKTYEKHIYESFYLTKDNLNYGYVNANVDVYFKLTIPNEIKDEEDAYIDAAKKDIKEYLVKNSIIEESDELEINNQNGVFSIFKIEENGNIKRSTAITEEDDEEYEWLMDIIIGKSWDKLLLANGLLVNQNEKVWAFEIDEEYLKSLDDVENYDNFYYYNNEIDKNTYTEIQNKVKEKGYTVWKTYHISSGNHFDKIVLTFSLGEENNNREIYILHKKSNGVYEEFNGVVKNGLFEIEVTEFSPFVVGLGNVVKDEVKVGNASVTRALDNEPKTGNETYISFAALLAALSLGSILVLKKRM